MRKPFIAGNWKMFKTAEESMSVAKGLVTSLKGVTDVRIAICPVYVNLYAVSEILRGTNVLLGGQNLFWEDSGAYTGEISAPQLKAVGCEVVIIGHSERRQYFGETDATVAKRLNAALKHGLTPIVCVGETLQEREGGKTEQVLGTQVEGGLGHLTAEQMSTVVIAYEPVWAIGTGKTATPEMANDAHAFIRGLISKKFGRDTAERVVIQYGGSVKPDNVKGLMEMPDIDGALVGGASLKVEDFTKIVRFKEK